MGGGIGNRSPREGPPEGLRFSSPTRWMAAAGLPDGPDPRQCTFPATASASHPGASRAPAPERSTPGGGPRRMGARHLERDVRRRAGSTAAGSGLPPGPTGSPRRRRRPVARQGRRRRSRRWPRRTRDGSRVQEGRWRPRSRIRGERTGDGRRVARGERGPQRHPAHEDGEDERLRMRGVTEKELEAARPDRFVDQSGKARGEEDRVAQATERMAQSSARRRCSCRALRAEPGRPRIAPGGH